MARYGKTLGEEVRTSEGREEDFLLGGQPTQASDRGKWLRSSAASVVLFFSLILFYSRHWIAGLILLGVFVALLVLNAPRGGAFYEDDNSVPPDEQ